MPLGLGLTCTLSLWLVGRVVLGELLGRLVGAVLAAFLVAPADLGAEVGRLEDAEEVRAMVATVEFSLRFVVVLLCKSGGRLEQLRFEYPRAAVADFSSIVNIPTRDRFIDFLARSPKLLR